jgi:hypothetical protein
VAASIYSVWRNQFIAQACDGPVRSRNLPVGSSRGDAIARLKNPLENFAARQGRGAGSSRCRLAGSTNQRDHRSGKLHRIVLAHPRGGNFSTPSAGGAFAQPPPDCVQSTSTCSASG